MHFVFITKLKSNLKRERERVVTVCQSPLFLCSRTKGVKQ